MGIRNLNRYLKEHCNTAITVHSLRDFSGKRVVVDTSIYLYRFIGENALIPQLYTMISILLSNHITPLFVFDGKAPPEKRELLRRRQVEKIEAREKYEQLTGYLETFENVMSEKDIDVVRKELEVLNRQMTRVTDEHLNQAKALMDACGVQWIVAEGESDVLCAYMVKSKKAWACMSDDMDMFVLGCTRVLRSFHLTDQTVMYYSLPSILRELGWSMTEFRQITVISGTDYNTGSLDTITTNLTETLKWFVEYRRSNTKCADFYDWLIKNTKYVKHPEELKHTYQLFGLADAGNPVWETHSDFRIQLKKTQFDAIRDILKNHGILLV
jgi:5'-3' exonuclease